MEEKYKLMPADTVQMDGRTLCRIRALRDFGDVKAGDWGGFVESENNLSHEGDCWIYNNAKVWDKAHISGDATVFHNARVYGKAKVYGKARIGGYAMVLGEAEVYDDAEVYAGAMIDQKAQVYGNSKVYGDAYISGAAWIFERAQIYGCARVHGNTVIHGWVHLNDNDVACGDFEIR